MPEMPKNFGEVPASENNEDTTRSILEDGKKRLAEILEEKERLRTEDPVKNKERLDMLELEEATSRQNIKNWEKIIEGKDTGA